MGLAKAKTIITPFIQRWEGCRLLAYADQGGRYTIGWGHTGGIQPGTEWTQAHADAQLQTDITQAMEQVVGVVKVPLTAHQLAALTSFTFNLGIANLCRSGLLKFLNQSKYDKAAGQFPLWDHIGLYADNGLLKRRQAEQALFNTKDV